MHDSESEHNNPDAHFESTATAKERNGTSDDPFYTDELEAQVEADPDNEPDPRSPIESTADDRHT